MIRTVLLILRPYESVHDQSLAASVMLSLLSVLQISTAFTHDTDDDPAFVPLLSLCVLAPVIVNHIPKSMWRGYRESPNARNRRAAHMAIEVHSARKTDNVRGAADALKSMMDDRSNVVGMGEMFKQKAQEDLVAGVEEQDLIDLLKIKQSLRGAAAVQSVIQRNRVQNGFELASAIKPPTPPTGPPGVVDSASPRSAALDAIIDSSGAEDADIEHVILSEHTPVLHPVSPTAAVALLTRRANSVPRVRD